MGLTDGTLFASGAQVVSREGEGEEAAEVTNRSSLDQRDAATLPSNVNTLAIRGETPWQS